MRLFRGPCKNPNHQTESSIFRKPHLSKAAQKICTKLYILVEFLLNPMSGEHRTLEKTNKGKIKLQLAIQQFGEPSQHILRVPIYVKIDLQKLVFVRLCL